MPEIILTETQRDLAAVYAARGLSSRAAALAARGRSIRLTERGESPSAELVEAHASRGMPTPTGVRVTNGSRMWLREPASTTPAAGSVPLVESARSSLVDAYVERGLPLEQARLAAAGRQGR